ncbi:sugar ABC transporter permease [Treponema sp. OttesenSCG-928-L16]|nr:sugar ABC transporter permease [Treponema sp. OttesenSCG-928-L16]
MLIFPSIFLLVIFLVYPLINTVWLSLWDYSYFAPEAKTFVGLRNYIYIFSEDENFRFSLWFTLRFTITCICLEFFIGLTLALVLKHIIRLGSIVRTIAIFPYMIAAIAVGQIWRLLFNHDYGLINYLLSFISLDPVNWLASSGGAFWAVVIAEIWRSMPFVMLVLLSGLQSIPNDIMEAARVDGANPVQAFFAITLPLLIPSISVALIFETIFKLRVFDIIVTLTGGGPGKATTPLGVLVQRSYFQSFEAGYSGAISVVLLLLGGIISAVYLKIIGSGEKNTI